MLSIMISAYGELMPFTRHTSVVFSVIDVTRDMLTEDNADDSEAVLKLVPAAVGLRPEQGFFRQALSGFC